MKRSRSLCLSSSKQLTVRKQAKKTQALNSLMKLWIGQGGKRCKENLYKSNPAIFKSTLGKCNYSDMFSKYTSLSHCQMAQQQVNPLLLFAVLCTRYDRVYKPYLTAADLLAQARMQQGFQLVFPGFYCVVRKHKMNLIGMSFRFLACKAFR